MTEFPNILFRSNVYLWMLYPETKFLTNQASIVNVDLLNQKITLTVNYDLIQELLEACIGSFDFEVRCVTFGQPNDRESGRPLLWMNDCHVEQFLVEDLSTPFVIQGNLDKVHDEIIKAKIIFSCLIKFP